MIRRATSADSGAIADAFSAAFRGLEFLPILHTDDETRAWLESTVLPTHEVWDAWPSRS